METKHSVDHDASRDDVDPEMPVLQKEADVANGYEDKQRDISVSVEALHATVTPPPTPPSERIGIEQKLITDEHTETFKATLASPSVGLKLTINREKIRLSQDSEPIMKTEIDQVPYFESGAPEVKNDDKVNMQSLLLQDALQSAKKYKEQLKQNRQLSPSKTIKPMAVNVSPIDSKLAMNQRIESPKYETHTKRTVIKTEQLAPKTNGVTDIRVPGHALNGGYLPKTDDMGRLSLPELMSAMTSAYG